PAWHRSGERKTNRARSAVLASGVTARRRSIPPRDDLDLVEHRPVLAGEDQTPGARVLRDAVQHVVRSALRGRVDARRVDPADDIAVVRIDACDPVLVPDVRPD